MIKLVVFSCVLAAASASYVAGIAPLTYAAPFVAPYNYRGPLSLAPGQPANILGSDGRPLDTLEVNLDRAAHLTTKTFNNVHLLKKRSIVGPYVAAPVTRVALTGAPYISHLSPYAIPAPLTYQAYAYPSPIAHALY